LVIIWLKRCCARPLIDAPLEPAPVGEGVGVGVDDGLGEGEGEGDGDGEALCANTELVCIGINTSEIAAASSVEKIHLIAGFAMLSVRTGRRRPAASPQASHPRNR
jgi:hypothetical protein